MRATACDATVNHSTCMLNINRHTNFIKAYCARTACNIIHARKHPTRTHTKHINYSPARALTRISQRHRRNLVQTCTAEWEPFNQPTAAAFPTSSPTSQHLSLATHTHHRNNIHSSCICDVAFVENCTLAASASIAFRHTKPVLALYSARRV